MSASILRGTGQIPVYRESTNALDAFRAAVDAIEQGECVAFYPEGTLTRDPDMWPMAGKTGAARVALLTKAPVIPVAQWGANLAMPPYAKEKKVRLFPRKTLKVHGRTAGGPLRLLRPGAHRRGARARSPRSSWPPSPTLLAGGARRDRARRAPYDHRNARAEQRRKAAGEGNK